MSDITEFRRRKDEAFATSEQSPLTDEQKADFQGLSYYPDDPNLVVTGVLEPVEDTEPFSVPTSTGQEIVYQRVGSVTFEIEGRSVSLTLLSSGHGGLFLPFRDATSGKETYGAGRYIDLHEHAHVGQPVTVDFNLAYNPYCAYNDAWSCPLPPPENWLDVPIRAGERAFTPS